MAFATAEQRIDAVSRAGNVLGMLRTVHNMAVRLQAMLTLYQAGTDPTFNAAFNVVFDAAADRNEIGEMIGELTALCITDWQINHATALGVS